MMKFKRLSLHLEKALRHYVLLSRLVVGIGKIRRNRIPQKLRFLQIGAPEESSEALPTAFAIGGRNRENPTSSHTAEILRRNLDFPLLRRGSTSQEMKELEVDNEVREVFVALGESCEALRTAFAIGGRNRENPSFDAQGHTVKKHFSLGVRHQILANHGWRDKDDTKISG